MFLIEYKVQTICIVTDNIRSYYVIAQLVCMVEDILKQQQPLCAAVHKIRKTDLMPIDVEVIAMVTFLDVMQPFVQISELAGAEEVGYTVNSEATTLQTYQQQPYLSFLRQSSQKGTE